MNYTLYDKIFAESHTFTSFEALHDFLYNQLGYGLGFVPNCDKSDDCNEDYRELYDIFQDLTPMNVGAFIFKLNLAEYNYGSGCSNAYTLTERR